MTDYLTDLTEQKLEEIQETEKQERYELMEKGGTCCISVLSSREKKSKGEFERLEEPSPLEGSLRLP